MAEALKRDLCFFLVSLIVAELVERSKTKNSKDRTMVKRDFDTCLNLIGEDTSKRIVNLLFRVEFFKGLTLTLVKAHTSLSVEVDNLKAHQDTMGMSG